MVTSRDLEARAVTRKGEAVPRKGRAARRAGPATSRTVFLDTGILVALAVPTDRHRDRAERILRAVTQGRWSVACTSDHVVAETLNFLQRKVRRRAVAEGLLDLLFGTEGSSPLVKDVHRVHSGRFAAALERYREHFDEGLSFTDWTTLVLLEELGVQDLATFDAGFQGRVHVVEDA